MRILTSMLVITVLVAAASSNKAWAQAGPDNRYCAPGNHAQFNGQDGPAALPQACLYTALSGTPSPGKAISVAPGGNLQSAVNSAQCGDTVAIQPDASFTGNYVLPARQCDDQHWITLRTAAPDSSLPDEGARMTPCYAGIAALPGRPDFSCSNPQRVIPQIVSSGPVSAITLAKGASHYRLLGLEITRTSGSGYIGPLVAVDPGTQADHIILDRVWAHGSQQDDTSSAISLTGMTYVAVIDSYLNDFHCTSRVGTCTDAKAIGGGTGSFPGGPYKIVGNFLEASGENILLGGGPATVTPADIEIRRNHMFKPLIWLQGQPGFVGGKGGNPFVVKNLTELKNAQRVLFEGNVLENSWGGFTQNGHFILLTPKNQIEGRNPTCPLCQVTDVTVRYSRMSHAGAGLCIAATLTGKHKYIYQAKAAARFSVHDITMDDIDAAKFIGGGGLFLIINGWSKNALNTISINHVTGFGDPNSHLLSLLDSTKNPQISTFGFTNNLVLAGRYPVWSAGGTNNCASSVDPIKNLSRCFNPYSFVSNGIIASPAQFPPSTWPAKNDFPADPNAVQFINYNNANGGDYHLLSSSPYKNAGTDGKDLGADVDGLLNATAGVD
jgi:hypothetical protein